MGIYASDALKCERQIAYRMYGADGLPFDISSALAMFDGRVMEDCVVAALDLLYKGRSQVRFDVEDGLVRGRMDYLYEMPRGTVVAEIKRTAAWPLKAAMKSGPKPEHWLQAALAAYSLSPTADFVHIIYVLRGSSQAGVPDVQEWLSPLSVHTDALNAELHRMRGVSAQVRAGDLPGTDWMGKRIEDVAAMRWPCSYCQFKPQCLSLESAPVAGWGADHLQSHRDRGAVR